MQASWRIWKSPPPPKEPAPMEPRIQVKRLAAVAFVASLCASLFGVVSISRAQKESPENCTDVFRAPPQLIGNWHEDAADGSSLTINEDGSYALREPGGSGVTETQGRVIGCGDLITLRPVRGKRTDGALDEQEVAERVMTYQWRLERSDDGQTHLVIRTEETGAPIQFVRTGNH
jgi:hypothetical protein